MQLRDIDGDRAGLPWVCALYLIRPRLFRRIFCVVLLAIVGCWLLVPAGAQSDDTTQASPTPTLAIGQAHPERYTVTGSVVNAVTGEPVRKALVQLQTLQQRVAFADGDGRFQFDGIPAGPVSLTAQKPGYFSEQDLRSVPRQFEAGPKADSIVLRLTPEGIIAGKVVNGAGTPLEHVPLSLTYLNIREGRRHWDTKGTAITAEDGRFRFANLVPGTYYLATTPFTPTIDSVFEVPAESTTGYPGMYYPGVPDLASSSPIALTAGQQLEANFSLTETPAYKISGTIVGYAPGQYVNLQLCDQSGTPLPFSYQFTPDNGRFDFHGVPSGNYILKAFSQSVSNQPVRGETRLDVTTNTYNLHLALSPWTSIPISVRMDSVAKAMPGARYARPASQGPPLGGVLLTTRPGSSDSYATLESTTGQHTLTFHNVEPGRYSVQLMAQDFWYVQSAEFGQTNLLTDDLILPAEAPPQAIQVVLRNDVASLTGTVKPANGASVPVIIVVVSERDSKRTPKTVQYFPPADPSAADQALFEIGSLAPGDYLVFAFDHAEGIEYSNPDVLQNYISQATHVTLAPNQRGRVTLDLIRTAEPLN